VYIIAKAAQVLRSDEVRRLHGISSVFVFGPRNSGKTQLQKFYLGLVGALGLLKEGSSSSSALISAHQLFAGGRRSAFTHLYYYHHLCVYDWFFEMQG
jgi:hypothetical protein